MKRKKPCFLVTNGKLKKLMHCLGKDVVKKEVYVLYLRGLKVEPLKENRLKLKI